MHRGREYTCDRPARTVAAPDRKEGKFSPCRLRNHTFCPHSWVDLPFSGLSYRLVVRRWRILQPRPPKYLRTRPMGLRLPYLANAAQLSRRDQLWAARTATSTSGCSTHVPCISAASPWCAPMSPGAFHLSCPNSKGVPKPTSAAHPLRIRPHCITPPPKFLAVVGLGGLSRRSIPWSPCFQGSKVHDSSTSFTMTPPPTWALESRWTLSTPPMIPARVLLDCTMLCGAGCGLAG
jgi:hypothetical protein